MRQSYFSYYEAYNARGEVLLNGNGSCEVEGGATRPENVGEHLQKILADVQAINPTVTRVVIKNLTKL